MIFSQLQRKHEKDGVTRMRLLLFLLLIFYCPCTVHGWNAKKSGGAAIIGGDGMKSNEGGGAAGKHNQLGKYG